MSRASLKILRWCETVAGVTPRNDTISPQVKWPLAETASKILRRVPSARAFDIFSTCERFIGRSAAYRSHCPWRQREAYLSAVLSRTSVTNHFYVHLNIEILRPPGAAGWMPPERGPAEKIRRR